MHAVVEGGVLFEGDGRRVVDLEALPQLAADEALCLVQRFEGGFLFFRAAEEAHVDHGFPQVSGDFHPRHGDEAEAGILQVAEEHLADFLFDEFLYFSDSQF